MGAGPRRPSRRRRASRALGPTAPRSRPPEGDRGGSVARARARRRGRALRPGPDAGPLPRRAARAGARPAAGEKVSARFRPLRRLDRPVRGVSRNCAPRACTSLLPPATRRRTFPLRRARAVGHPPALAVVRLGPLVRPRDRRGDEAALHRAAAPRLRPLDEAPRALLPVRRVDARPLLRRRDHVPDLPLRAAVAAAPSRLIDPIRKLPIPHGAAARLSLPSTIN